MIISIASLKGGCGCSSLLVLLAHHLSISGKTVYLIELSLPGSLDLLYCRSKLLEEQLPFEFFRSDMQKASLLIDRLNEQDHMLLIDIPKTFSDRNLQVILEKVDRFIIPFQYDLISLHAASGFSLLINKFSLNSKSIFLPNRNGDTHFDEELQSRQEMLRSLGALSAPIPLIVPLINLRSMQLPPACLFELAPSLQLLCNQYLFNPLTDKP